MRTLPLVLAVASGWFIGDALAAAVALIVQPKLAPENALAAALVLTWGSRVAVGVGTYYLVRRM